MSVMQETQVLLNGTAIPRVGLGTWQMSPEDALRSVEFALRNGYVHVDTARTYGNSHKVGEAWHNAGVKREDIWLTTKVNGNSKSYEEAKADIEKELECLQTEYIDLMLIHCPQPWDEYQPDGSGNRYFAENLEVWRAMEEFYAAGKLKAIGVSNFGPADIQNIIDNSKVKPQVNQISYRIGNTQPEITAYCAKQGIVVEAYSPLGTGSILANEDIRKVAASYDKSVAQVAIKYCLQKGHVVLPKSKTEKYILENTQLEFELSPEDMQFLDGLNTL